MQSMGAILILFLSTLSLRRATIRYDNYNLHCTISIHALLAESDNPPSITPAASRNFYPRSPCGERPHLRLSLSPKLKFLSTLSLRRATYQTEEQIKALQFLSTLSLRRATLRDFAFSPSTSISIHALLAESDGTPKCSSVALRIFLSTLSLRRATLTRSNPSAMVFVFLSTLSLRRATGYVSVYLWSVGAFLSTLSLRRATMTQGAGCIWFPDFYPRSPCGERPGTKPVTNLPPRFLSTLSLRRATGHVRERSHHQGISIHALLAESDGVQNLHVNPPLAFLSTLSLRRATSTPGIMRFYPFISIHALLAESDQH